MPPDAIAAEFRFPTGPDREVQIVFVGTFAGVEDVDHVIEMLTLWRNHDAHRAKDRRPILPPTDETEAS